jgi:hypothetical protein
LIFIQRKNLMGKIYRDGQDEMALSIGQRVHCIRENNATRGIIKSIEGEKVILTMSDGSEITNTISEIICINMSGSVG